MPELPEVQTIVNDLNKKVVGRKILAAWHDWAKTIKKPAHKEFERQLKGAKILRVRRRGKNILIFLNGGRVMLIHQKMTGHLLYGKWRVKEISSGKYQVSSAIRGPLQEKVNDYIHLIFYLDNGYQLALSDLRKFAKVMLGGEEEILNSPDLKSLGPDALDSKLTFEKFKKLIMFRGSRERTGTIKQILMDQSVVAGIGNIYADDILWSAKIHPLRRIATLGQTELKEIYLAMRRILKKSLKLRGTSISDFRDTAGRPGSYADHRLAYQREGEPCKRCGAPIKRLKLGGRSAHYCPRCQKV